VLSSLENGKDFGQHWMVGRAAYDQQLGIDGARQGMDGVLSKAPFEGIGLHVTDQDECIP
jgi:hypothetical protein